MEKERGRGRHKRRARQEERKEIKRGMESQRR